jgi:hypothetical protein
MNAKTCSECGQSAARLRRERCDACYMRLYRSGEVPAGSSCAGCDERRRDLLCFEAVRGAQVVVCGNCALVLRRTRPRLGSVAELRGRLTRERRRRGGAGAAASARSRRASDRRAERQGSSSGFDVSCD